MQNNRFKLSYIIVIILVGILVFGLGFTSYSNKEPITVYKVYIDGEIIGTVSSKEEFNNYINQKEQLVKDKYGVDKVYMPNGVTLKKVTTYDKKIDSNDTVYHEIIKLKPFTIKGVVITIDNKEVDPIYEDVLEFAISNGKISASLLQRRFKLGYNRAARIVDLLEERGIIGPPNGSKPREVLVQLDSKEEVNSND